MKIIFSVSFSFVINETIADDLLVFSPFEFVKYADCALT